MFINKTENNANNIIGPRVAEIRKGMNLSQRALADKLQIGGLEIDKNAIQRIECGKRFVTDIELVHFSRALGVSYDALLSENPMPDSDMK